VKRPIQVSIQDFPTNVAVVFIDPKTQSKIGPVRRYSTNEMVFELLRRAHANLETINLVELAFAERRPIMIDLHLTEEQIAALSRRGR